MNPWYLVSSIGSPRIWIVLSVILLVVYILLRQYRWQGHEKSRRLMKRFLVLFLVSLWVTFGATVALKEVIDIPRNCVMCPPGESGQLPLAPPLLSGEGGAVCNPYCLPDSSFPSGHTATAFALFTSIYIILGRKQYLLLFVVPALVGIARVMLGVHTVPDIIGGGMLGIALVTMMWWLERKELKWLK